jgi:signal transduction histidine kinase
VRVAAANVFVFAIWSFLFFRILLNQSLQDSWADIGLLIALVILGVLLIRSFNKEIDDRALVERVEKERAIEQAKSEFISIAAHQLRTPLAGIRWTFNVLESSASGLTKEERDLVAKGSERTKDVVERVNEMLRAAQLTGNSFTIDLQSADVRTVLRESVTLLEPSAKMRSLTINLNIPDAPLRADIDADKFSIAVQNLVDNAIKYTEKGSIDVSGAHEGSDIVIRVKDSGIGIIEADKAHLFEKFYRHDTAKKMFTDGSGLGLFIVKKITDAHHGTVKVESKSKEGSTFTIRIPASKKG